MALAQDLFDAQASGYAMGIRGYEFDGFGEQLSVGAELNLALAAQFLVPVLRDRALDRIGASRDAKSDLNGMLGEEDE
jgi:hypothetical protein